MMTCTVPAHIKEYIYSVNLDPVVTRLVKIDGWKRKHALAACKQYRDFIFLRKKYGHQYELPPSVEMDEVWHAHVLHTKDYFTFCDTIFGEYLHHNPHLEGGTYTLKDLQQLFEKETDRLYLKEFGDHIYAIRPPSVKEIVAHLVTVIRRILVPQRPKTMVPNER